MRPTQLGHLEESREEVNDGCKNKREGETHWEKREGQTDRWKDRLHTENVIDGKRGGNIEWW